MVSFWVRRIKKTTSALVRVLWMQEDSTKHLKSEAHKSVGDVGLKSFLKTSEPQNILIAQSCICSEVHYSHCVRVSSHQCCHGYTVANGEVAHILCPGEHINKSKTDQTIEQSIVLSDAVAVCSALIHQPRLVRL